MITNNPVNAANKLKNNKDVTEAIKDLTETIKSLKDHKQRDTTEKKIVKAVSCQCIEAANENYSGRHHTTVSNTSKSDNETGNKVRKASNHVQTKYSTSESDSAISESDSVISRSSQEDFLVIANSERFYRFVFLVKNFKELNKY